MRFEKKERVSKNDVFKVLEKGGCQLGEIRYMAEEQWGFENMGQDHYMCQEECEMVAAKLKELNNAEI